MRVRGYFASSVVTAGLPVAQVRRRVSPGRSRRFWNTSIYQFATQPNSPFTPLDATGTGNDNLYYTGTAGQLFNVGTGLGTPDVAKLAADFARTGG
jgi:hypothetical protein